MKHLIITCFLGCLYLFADELAWVDEQIKAIKPPRDGIKQLDLLDVHNPFEKYSSRKQRPKILHKGYGSKSTVKRKQTSRYLKPYGLKINTIINNSARINNKWYKQNQKVGKYTLKRVNNTDVILTHAGRKYLLSIHTKNKKVKIKK